MAKKAVPKDTLDQFAEDAARDPRLAIMLMLWQGRHRNPEMAIQITERDITGFRDCIKYLEVHPEVKILRPQGRPGQAAIPAQGKRRAVPGRPAEPPRPYVAVNLVQAGTMDGFKPIENNEQDAQLRDQGNAARRARDKGAQLAAQLMSDMRVNVFSTATITEACEVLTTLARAHT